MIQKIRKRDGRIDDFDPSKIAKAIHKSFLATRTGDGEQSKNIANHVVELIDERISDIPGIEDVQDIVEEVLIKSNNAAAAKAYIIYREKRSQIRKAKAYFGVKDDLKLSVNAVRVLERYLLKNEKGNVVETPMQFFRRIAKAAAFDPELEEEFFKTMINLEFLPDMNAGTDIGLSASFFIPFEDSLTGIFDAVKDMALILQSGGGTCFSFSNLRPAGDIVRYKKGVASGPVSFMKVFDRATGVIKQGRPNMGILRADHPDIIEFITAKTKEGVLPNFNISVAVDGKFMEAVRDDREYDLINPRNGEVVKKIRAQEIWDLIISTAWRTGEPGVVFIDEINRPMPNPCGGLLPYEACNPGSINLAKIIKKASIDWEKLENIINIAVKFLDNMIDVNIYPLPRIGEITRANRKIGLGVMGFADMLVQLGIPYDSGDALGKAEEIMSFIQEKSHLASEKLAHARGSSRVYKTKMRNSTVTTIAPTGTISVLAGCSNGIEPLSAVSFVEGTKLIEVNPYFEALARERGFYSEELMMKIAGTGTLTGIDGIPDDVKRVFVTASDITPEWHVRMQAAFQKYTDNAVSKSINFRNDIDVREVERAYILAYELKCKGITVYRYGSKVIHPGDRYVSDEYSGGSPLCPV